MSFEQWYKQRFKSHRTIGRLFLGFIVFLPISVILFVATGTLIIFGILPSLALGCLIDVFVFGTTAEKKRGIRFLGESLLVGAIIFHLFTWGLTGVFIPVTFNLPAIGWLFVMYIMFGGVMVYPAWKIKEKLVKKSRK